MYYWPMAKALTVNREWTFLSNHGHLLVHLNRNPDSRVRDIAEAVGITERSAQTILADLEEAGYASSVVHVPHRPSRRIPR